MKWFVLIAFIGIVGSLASALVFMMRGGTKPGDGTPGAPSPRMMRALAARVGISALLFLCILLAWKLGYIQPTGLQAGH